MNFTIARLTPIARELRGIREQLKRLADLYELDLRSRGVPLGSEKSQEIVAEYVNEEDELLREIGRQHGFREEQIEKALKQATDVQS